MHIKVILKVALILSCSVIHYCDDAKRFFLVITGRVPIGSKRLSRPKRVIGGSHVHRGDRPWLVSLHGEIVTQKLFGIIPIKHRHVHCGGTLLNDRWILTAAHCFDFGGARDVDSWTVRLAAIDLKVAFADRIMDLLGRTLDKADWRLWNMDVSRIIIYPGYNRGDLWHNDIALVKLEDRVPSSFEHVQSIQLADYFHSISFPRVGSACYVYGFGCTKSGGVISRYANSISIPILQNSVCENTYDMKSHSGRLCAGSSTDNSGICPGDSGGPLICEDYYGQLIQVGIASFTSKVRPEYHPAVFTRVADYRRWIKRYTG